MTEHLIAILAATVGAATPLLLAGIGELITEKSGVINLGVEGMMLIGAIAGFATVVHSDGYVVYGLLGGMVAGMAAASLFALIAISLSASQAATGLALTIFGVGLSAFIGKHYTSYSLPGLQHLPIPLLSDIPVIGPVLFNQDPVVYLTYVLFGVATWIITKTKIGLILRAVGESPEAAHAVGYSVLKIRWLATLTGGAFAGIAGAYLSTVYTPIWVENMTAGRGWIAVALVVFSAWKPWRLLLGACLFGGVTIMQYQAQAIGLHISVDLLAALPYLATIAVLVLIGRNPKLLLNFPASLGKPFLPGA